MGGPFTRENPKSVRIRPSESMYGGTQDGQFWTCSKWSKHNLVFRAQGLGLTCWFLESLYLVFPYSLLIISKFRVLRDQRSGCHA